MLETISSYVISLFNQHPGSSLFYHNLAHTKTEVKRAGEIANNYILDEIDFFVLSTAAWFHDTGHLFGAPALHEDRSVNLMQDFSKEHGAEKDIIDKIIIAFVRPNCRTSLNHY